MKRFKRKVIATNDRNGGRLLISGTLTRKGA